MSRVQPRNLEEKQRAEFLNMFWTSIAELKSRDEVKAFFKDLLSESEAIMLARRIKIAERLLQGVDYEEIQSELHVGRSTIASVHQWLTSGFQGYETAIKKFTPLKNASRPVAWSSSIRARGPMSRASSLTGFTDVASHRSKGARPSKRGQSSSSRQAKNKPRPFSLLNLIGGQR